MKSLTITAFIRLVVVSLLLLWFFLLVKPFIGVLSWGIILAVALFPVFQKFTGLFGDKHKKRLTSVFSIILISLLIVPTYLVTSSVVRNANKTLHEINNNEFKIDPPSKEVKQWPLIGEKLYDNWNEFSTNSQQYVKDHKDFLTEKGTQGIKSFAGIIGTILAFLLSLIIAIMFMSNAQGAYKASVAFINKLAINKGEEMLLIARDTIRNVVKGILFVAILQAFLCYLGFKFIGIPAASIFALIAMLSAIIGVPVTLVVIPTIIMAFSISDNTVAVVGFTIYIILVSLLDNVLKPILLAKGLKTPMVLIILGALGGILLHGLIGLFVGTVLVAVLHQLYLAWLANDELVDDVELINEN